MTVTDSILSEADFINHYEKNSLDKEVDGLVWNVYGIVLKDVDYVYVTATFNGETTGLKVESEIISPPIQDRVFGIDERDLDLAFKMSHRIYEDLKLQKKD